MASPDSRLIVTLCSAQVAGMLGLSTFSTLLPELIVEWHLTNTEAGWLNGVLFGGYAGAVLFLMGLTDRVDARRVFLVCSLLSCLSMLAFAWYAEGFWSALALRALSGVALAGTYMPGMRVLTDRLTTADQSRGVAFYTACYGIGTAASFYLSAEIAAQSHWRWAFAAIAAGPLIAWGLVILATRPIRIEAAASFWAGFNFRPVFSNRRAMAYIVGYTLHTAELMAFLSWLVAFLTFAAERNGGGAGAIGFLAAMIALVGLPASIGGNEGALRFGRRRFITVVMIATAAASCLVGFSAELSFAAAAAVCLLYGGLIAGDSASLTAGTVGAAAPGRQGVTVAMHSFLGFGGAFVGPLIFGIVLDVAGGRTSTTAWAAAFAVIGLATLIGPIVLARWAAADPRDPQPR